MKILEMLEKAATQNVSNQQKERFLSNFFFLSERMMAAVNQ